MVFTPRKPSAALLAALGLFLTCSQLQWTQQSNIFAGAEVSSEEGIYDGMTLDELLEEMEAESEALTVEEGEEGEEESSDDEEESSDGEESFGEEKTYENYGRPTFKGPKPLNFKKSGDARDWLKNAAQGMHNPYSPSGRRAKQEFDDRQEKKRDHLRERIQQTADKLTDHHEGRKLMNDKQFQRYTREKESLERKLKSLEKEQKDHYYERMEQRDRKMFDKMNLKDQRREQRANMMKFFSGEF